LDNALYHFERQNIVFKNEEQISEVVKLVVELANNVRLWENNGFTLDEL